MEDIIKFCKRCLLSDEFPGVRIDDSKLCSVCTEYDLHWGDWENQKVKRLNDLWRIFNKAKRKKRPYDVLVPISGGKDSTYILYLCRKLFDLKCLALTFDNGFLTDHARENINNACQILGVDHIYYGMSKPLLMQLYRYFFVNSGFFCPVCMGGIAMARNRVQLAFNIPLSIRGTSGRTEEHVSSEFFLDGTPSFIENVLKGSTLEKDAELLLTPSGFLSSPPAIVLPEYIDWDYKEIYNTIINELGWKAHSREAEHTDCKVENIVTYFRYKKFPVLIPEMLRFSKLVTCGQMTREEAEKRVAENKSKTEEPQNLTWFLEELGITRKEMDSILSDPFRHFKYLKKNSAILRRIRALKKKRLLII